MSDVSIALTLSKWNVFQEMFMSYQLSEYLKTGDWSHVLTDVGVLIVEEEAFINDGKLLEAHEKLEEIRADVRFLRGGGNKTVLLTDLMLVYYDNMEKVIEPYLKKWVRNKNPVHFLEYGSCLRFSTYA